MSIIFLIVQVPDSLKCANSHFPLVALDSACQFGSDWQPDLLSLCLCIFGCGFMDCVWK